MQAGHGVLIYYIFFTTISCVKIKGLFLRNGIYWLAVMKNGKRTQKSLSTRNLSEAVIKRAEILARGGIADGKHVQPSEVR